MKAIVAALLVLFLAGQKSASHPLAPLHVSTAAFDTYVNANNILMIVSNDGLCANDRSGMFGYFAGMFYPFTSVQELLNGSHAKSPLYSYGLWMGGHVNGTTRVTVAEFASEYWPGPMSGGSFLPHGDTAEEFRVYKIYADSLESNPNRDYTEWPIQYGAPTDSSSLPAIEGEQLLWCVYNDANAATHIVNSGGTAPFGVEIRQSVWASSAPGYERIIFLRYDLYNLGSETITDMYLGFFYDPDIGGASDDLTGCDSSNQMFYAYNSDDDDLQYGNAPPAIGIRLIHGPAIPSLGDSSWQFDKMVPDSKALQLSSYVAYPNGDDPQTADESYNLLRGLSRNGTALGNGTTYEYSGDPVAGVGDLDLTPGNPHGVAACGPFVFAPGDSQSVVLKIGVGQGANRLESVQNLKVILTPSDSIIDNRQQNLPHSYELHQNYPNPFNGSTTIEYGVPTTSAVTIDVFNILGQQVRTLVKGIRAHGRYQATWDGTDSRGRQLSSGVYYYRIRSGNHTSSRAMVLLK